MNLYPKKINLYQFTPNSCQFMLIYRRYFITYPSHAPHIDTPTPIFSLKTRICPQNQKKNLKNPNFPPILKNFSYCYVNLRKLFPTKSFLFLRPFGCHFGFASPNKWRQEPILRLHSGQVRYGTGRAGCLGSYWVVLNFKSPFVGSFLPVATLRVWL